MEAGLLSVLSADVGADEYHCHSMEKGPCNKSARTGLSNQPVGHNRRTRFCQYRRRLVRSPFRHQRKHRDDKASDQLIVTSATATTSQRPPSRPQTQFNPPNTALVSITLRCCRPWRRYLTLLKDSTKVIIHSATYTDFIEVLK